MALDDEALEQQAQELAEKALVGLKEPDRSAKLVSVRQSILHRLRSQAIEASRLAACSAGDNSDHAEQLIVQTGVSEGAQVVEEVALASPPSPDPLILPLEDDVQLFGDEHWYNDEGLLKQQRAHVAAAHAEQKILVGSPDDETKRICPAGGRVLGAGAALRLGGAHHGGYGEADIGYAYRQLSRAVHPDKNPNNAEAPAAFKRLQDAADELRELLKQSRSVLHVLCGTRRAEPTPEVFERPQGPLIAEASRVLAAVLGLSGEGILPEGSIALAAASWQRFDHAGRDIVVRWYESEDLLKLYAGTPIRIAYDCAQKHYRAQFICALSRAAEAEAKRNEGCIRGTWQAVLAQFPEISLWRECMDRVKARVWAPKRHTSKWDDRSGPRTSAWGRLWRTVLSDVLPKGPESPTPTNDQEMKRLGAVLWKEIVTWAKGDSDNCRALNLFRADDCTRIGCDKKIEWAFLPFTDLLLAVGDVGVTTKGFVGGSGICCHFEDAYRTANSVAEVEEIKEADEAENHRIQQERKRRKISEAPTCCLLVSGAHNSHTLEGECVQEIVNESRRFGTLMRCVPRSEKLSDVSVTTLLLQLERKRDAKNVKESLHDRQFSGNTIQINFLEDTGIQESLAESQKSPSKVLLLKNLATPGTIDVEFESKILEEARKFGRVRKCVIREVKEAPVEDSVQIFICFRLAPDASTAFANFHGVLRDGRVVRASFYDEQRFREEEMN